MNPNVLLLLAVTLSLIFSSVGLTANTYAQLPKHCGYSYEHRCVLPDEEEAEKLSEVFPNAIVEVNEDLYDSIPDEDREDAEGIIEKGPLETEQNNFQPIPQGNENLPPVEQSSAGLIDNCIQSGFSKERCENMLLSDDPGGYCSTLKLANLPCPKIQDPSFTFGNPGDALEQSRQQIQNIQSAIDQCIALEVCQ
ncbi:hypothetical protein [Candidatus Nitrosocosmicus sp. SS]|jgi:hypothetical protein|uniref:hypothetical protein n=1 Tax=Candidatus Nitrosocosmicus agrestis TaxID=2563600 RepID=UPI00122E0B91|nr:hypothetical protein [Candidatus Nitrosocosmicus sp. SS]KAA2283115.1 hypothetical protein F1Z66_03285 [Candidatus Nitrosocosmicus sp. SS]KAF0868571.1 hypothetical protein E5N71_09315 [Candidatus Nitrosocosmicus sp. SS]